MGAATSAMTSGRGGADAARVALPALGLAVAVALYGLVIWVPASLLGEAGDGATSGAGLSLVASGVHAGVLLVLACLAAALPAATWRRACALASCAGVAASVVCWVAAFVLGDARPEALSAAAAVLAGAGVAASFLWWLGDAVSLDARPRHVLLTGAAALAALFSALGAVLPLFALRVLVCGLLLVAAVLVVADVRQARTRVCPPGVGAAATSAEIGSAVLDGDPADPAAACAPASASATSAASPSLAPATSASPVSPCTLGCALVRLLPVLAAAVVISLAAPFVNGVLMVDALPLQTRSVISGLMSLLVAVVLGVVWLVPGRKSPSVLALLLAFTIVLFGAFVLNALLVGRLSLIVLALSSAGYFLVLYLFMEAALEVARDVSQPVAVVYGTAGALVMVARIVADALSLRLLHAGLTEDVKVLVTMFLMVYLLTCAGFALYHALTRSRQGRDRGQGVDGQESEVSGGPHASEGESRLAQAAPSDWELLARKCDLVASSRDLSQREREVLVLMMRGRNVPAISEELSISRNTVQTHVRHLYEALDVHSRKELVALVESAGEAPEREG